MLNSTHIFTSEREKLSDNVRSNIPKIFFRKAIGSSNLDPFIIGWDFLVQGRRGKMPVCPNEHPTEAF